MTEIKRKAPGAEKPGKLPKKTGINLAIREGNSTVRTLVIGLALIAALVMLVVKFGVYDQFARLNRARDDYNGVHAQYLTMLDAVSDFEAVQKEYRTYSMDWMNAEEDFVSVDRIDVLELVEGEFMARGSVEAIQIADDTLTAAMSGMDLEQISAMFDAVSANPIVRSVILNLAETKDSRIGEETPKTDLEFVITVRLQPAEEVAE